MLSESGGQKPLNIAVCRGVMPSDTVSLSRNIECENIICVEMLVSLE